MYKQDDWDDIVKLFIYDLSNTDISLDKALHLFLNNYTGICRRFEEECSEDISEEFQEEPLDVYFERKLKPMWDYVYNLQKQVNNLHSKVGDLELHKNQAYGPVKYPNNFYPDVIPGNVPPWKITPHANGYVPNTDFMTTTGYFQTVEEPKYTQEQIKEWSNLMYNDPAERR